MLSYDDTATVQKFLKDEVGRTSKEPQFARHDGEPPPFRLDADGLPAVRVAVANAALDTDVWAGLRSPAAVGLHPVDFRDIWDYYAAKTVKSVRRDGSPNYLAIPESFDDARSHYRRAVMVSALLPISAEVFESYADSLEEGETVGCAAYSRAAGDVSKMISRSVARLSLALLGKDRAVICMDAGSAGKVAEFTKADSESGKYHGPCNSPFPQNSVAVLTGLMQFGVSRLPMRDEVGPDGKVVRMMGNYCSLVAFDPLAPVTGGAGGVVTIDDDWLERLRRLSDFSVVGDDTVAGRYCAYNSTGVDGHSVCGRCIRACPAGAIANSVPGPDGKYAERILKQKHRFHGAFLDFDFGNCSSDRQKKGALYSEYSCARCLAVCAAGGVSGLTNNDAANAAG